MGGKLKYVLIAALLASGFSYSQTVLSGRLKADTRTVFGQYEESAKVNLTPMQPAKKSVFLAGLLSFVLPGAGEFYAESYWKAAAFIALETAVITTALVYDKKGDDQTVKFEGYADENWSVVRYAEWLNQYQNANIPINPNTALPPWERVDWNLLNAAETGSHKLPRFGEQQYYELIGKYHQYSSGWNDFTGGGNKELISPNFTYYSGMRGKANDYYNIASKAVIGIYVNHFLSMLDAVWTAVSFNKNISVSTRLYQEQLADRIEFVPTVNLKFNF